MQSDKKWSESLAGFRLQLSPRQLTPLFWVRIKKSAAYVGLSAIYEDVQPVPLFEGARAFSWSWTGSLFMRRLRGELNQEGGA